MAKRLDREGVFLARMTDQAVRQYDSGSVMLEALFEITAMWDKATGGWQDWAQYELHECMGWFSLIGTREKGSLVNERTIESLAKALNCQIDFELLQETDWSGVIVQIKVKQDTDQQGNPRFKAAFINPADATPTLGIQKSDRASLDGLNAAFGSQLRAVMPTGLGDTPPPPKPEAVVEMVPVADDDIPF